VNERLGKQEYDCSNILEDYDCGCGADEAELDNSVEEDHLFFELNKEEKQLG
jgi:FAD-linked sulfhydryl oxidase